MSAQDTATEPRCSVCGVDPPTPGGDGRCQYCVRYGLDKQRMTGAPPERAALAEIARLDAAGPEPARLGALSRGAALDRVAARPPEWIVQDILSTGDYGVLAGRKGAGKTLALIDLGVSVALGYPWFGRFPTAPHRVLLLTSEDSEARLWARADAVAGSLSRDPGELEGRLYVHPLPFDAIRDLDRLGAELDILRPGLVILDPAYKYLAGAKPQLFDMGAALTPLQTSCTERGAALLVGHHYNRRVGAEREERISGAGLLEWARVVITMEVPPTRDESPEAIVRFDITGNSIGARTFRVERHVSARDEGPNPELIYGVDFLDEGEETRAVERTSARERVLAALPRPEDAALTVRQIGDLVANDATKKGGLRHDTIRKTLQRLREAGEAASRPVAGELLWWRP